VRRSTIKIKMNYSNFANSAETMLPILSVELIIGESKQPINVLIDSGFDGFLALTMDDFENFGFSRFIDGNLDISMESITGESVNVDALELPIMITPLKFERRGIIITYETITNNIVGLEFLQYVILTLNGIESYFD
jgi:predicted aspartyl protease